MEEHIIELESRLSTVERSVAALKADLSPAVEELKEAVEDFRRRLHEAETSFWFANCRGGMGHPDSRGALNSVHPYWRHVKYRRKVEEEVNEVVSKFKTICNSEINKETQKILRLPSFNTWAWDDAELILLLQHMYKDLGLTERFNIDMDVLRAFFCNVYLNYNQVPFHNFRHGFCVAQMMYGMVCKCDLQRRLGDLNILILLTSCVCHDLDHPGFNNIYQINAKTELALRYNDISPLENHHCAVAFNILENNNCNILRNLTQEEYKNAREGIIRCILATDMARHNEILQEFRDVMPEFDFEDKNHVNLLFMILIKVADISNEARPLDIAEPWLECLMQEFFNQSDLEKMEGLPVSPFMDREKVTKPSSQCSFIGFVLLPLFESLGEVLTELEDLIIVPVKEALEYYRRLNEGCKKQSSDERDDKESPEEVEETGNEKENEPEPPAGESGSSSPSNLKRILSKTESFTSLRSRTSSRTSGLVRAASSRETDPDFDQTETEVEVSERTSKFKISTEASRRNSYERKGSIDRRCSVERTVSPRMLEERLRTHAEAEAELQPSPSEHDEEQQLLEHEGSPPHSAPPTTSTNTSILDRIKHFSGRLTSDKDKTADEHSIETGRKSGRNSLSLSPKYQKYHSVLKRKNGTESVDSKSSSSSTSTSKAHISFASFAVRVEEGSDPSIAKIGETSISSSPIVSKRKNSRNAAAVELNDEREDSRGQNHPSENDKIQDNKKLVEMRKQEFPSCIGASPTHSERCVSTSNSFLRNKKKFSLSLDVLPRRNGRSRKDTSSQRVSSDDLFSRASSPKDPTKRHSHNSSPKILKKKQESAKAILLRSLSFKKKSSPSKDETSTSLQVAAGANSQDVL